MSNYSRIDKNNNLENTEKSQRKSSKENKIKKKKNMSKLKVFLIIFLLIVVSWFIILYINFSKTYSDNDNFIKRSIDSKSALTLIVGVDGLAESELKESSNNNDKDNRHGIRSDSIMLVATNPNKKEVKTLSIYRDLLSKNACTNQFDKINASFTSGWYQEEKDDFKSKVSSGASCLKKTIESEFDLKIDNYVVINFSGFERIINSVGGVDVDIIGGKPNGTKFCEQDKNSQNGNPDEQSWDKGKYCFVIGDKMHLNGEEALSYSRHRHSDNDIWRTKRQNEVLRGIINSAKNPINLLLFPFKSTTIGEAVTTNITSSDVTMFILKNIFSLGDFNINHIELSFENNVRNGIYYLNIPDAEKKEAAYTINNFLTE